MELYWLGHQSPYHHWTFTVFLLSHETTWLLLPHHSSFDVSPLALLSTCWRSFFIASTPGDYGKRSELPHGRSDGLLFAVAGTLLPLYSSFDLSFWVLLPTCWRSFFIAFTPGDYGKGSKLPHSCSDGLLFAVAGTLNYSFLILVVLKPLWRSAVSFLYHLLYCLCHFINFFISSAPLSLGLLTVHFRMSWSHGSVVFC